MTLATALGKSRDTKAIALRVEPYLIERGYLQVGHGGRSLTDAGVSRAQQLAKAGVK
jgi:Holliday junction resolvasome RuvABC ATP-dependent DNA helicase subunit